MMSECRRWLKSVLYFLKNLIITFVTFSLAGVDRLGALSVDLLFFSPFYYNGGYFVSAAELWIKWT